jgi:penicillin-binding protein 1A
MLRKLFKFFFYLSVIIGILGSLAIYVGYRYYTLDLPDFRDNISAYKPKLINQFYTSEGYLLAEFYSENRRLAPFSDIPAHVVDAFVAVEDRRFYEHKGLDYQGIIAALIANIKEREITRGGSTITQQVTKNIVLSPERSLSRKIKEAILAFRIERNLSKQEILYLYLNHIYLGDGAYGVEAASKNYFGVPVKDISIAQAAILAGLPKRPGRYNPRKYLQRAMDRQKTVLKIMRDIDYISEEQLQQALAEEIVIARKKNINNNITPYFVEYVRRYLEFKYGTAEYLNGGFKVFTSMDTDLSLKGQWAVRKGVIDIEKRRGRKEIVKHIGQSRIDSYIKAQNEIKIEVNQIYEAAVVNISSIRESNFSVAHLKIGNNDGILKYVVTKEVGKKVKQLPFKYSNRYSPINGYDQIDILYKRLKVGDIINVKIIDKEEQKFIAKLYHKPQTQAALVSMDTNGFIRSMIGGYDFSQNQFNRATQALRQPGSAFKPILYTSALDKGYTASTMVYDIPVVMKEWTPENYDESYLGPIILKDALAKSRNLASIRLILDITPSYVVDYSKYFHFKSKLNPYPSLALGGSEATLLEMVKAFNVFATNGRYIEPKFIYRIYDRNGKIIEDYTEGVYFSKEEATKADRDIKREKIIKNIARNLGRDSNINTQRSYLKENNLSKFYKDEIASYNAPLEFLDLLKTSNNLPFINSNLGTQTISEESAYIMTYMLEAVVKEGTAKRAKPLLDKAPVAGKTGTTNDFTDAWFIGFSPKIVTGVWVGKDNHKSLGKKEAGSKAALPIWIEFMNAALDKYPGGEFEQPSGVKFVSTPHGDLPFDISTCADLACEAYITQGIGYKDNSIKEQFNTDTLNEADFLMRH